MWLRAIRWQIEKFMASKKKNDIEFLILNVSLDAGKYQKGPDEVFLWKVYNNVMNNI